MSSGCMLLIYFSDTYICNLYVYTQKSFRRMWFSNFATSAVFRIGRPAENFISIIYKVARPPLPYKAIYIDYNSFYN